MSARCLIHFGICPLGLVLALALSRSVAAAETRIDPETLRPGLAATYQDAEKTHGVRMVLLEPAIALALKKGEAPHPRLSAEGGTVRWEGYLKVFRAGTYRFSAQLRGKLRFTVAGKEMLAAEVQTDAPALKQGPQLRLEAGVHLLAAEFTRLPGSARLEVHWESPYFLREPLPYRALCHLPAKLPAAYHTSMALERGRYLVEERNCMGCHRPGDSDALVKGLSGRQGPDLSKVGGRVYANWLHHWLEAPHKVRPGTSMPALFGSDAAGKAERYAVARYLALLGGPLKPAARQPRPKEIAVSVGRGQRLFTSIGCVACHQADAGKEQTAESSRSLTGARTNYPLSGLGSKTTPEKLAVYLEDPLAVDPSGRMPHMLLKKDEARDLARYLCADRDPAIAGALPAAPGKEALLAAFRQVDKRADELAAFQRLPADAQWQDLGKRVVIDRGCNNCHTIAPGGKGFANMLASASFNEIKSPKVHRQGCLVDDPGKRGRAPGFNLGAAEREAVRRFLREGTVGAGSPAPTYAGRVTLERFNCLACHRRNGAGGLTDKLVEQLRKYEKADNAEAVSPPPLTEVGHKLRTPWIREVLIHARRARPWLGLRMPQFGEANVGKLPEVLAALEGSGPEDRVPRVKLTGARIEAGRRLVGKQGFGCISCHDIAGIPNTGTRGPDLASMNQRVRPDWYRRWLQEASRMQPGTRMPTIFSDGKSPLDTVLGGSPDAQAEAMWAYLSLGPNLHLPEGLEPPRGLVLTVKDRPVLLRTFMPDAGSRAVAVGYLGGVSTAFDAQTCRLAYGWSGNFLDASPVWNDRGGAPARVLGTRFWTAPAGCPWAASDSNDPPDFAARAKDPAFGADPGKGKVFQGKRRLFYEGYALDKAGGPAFRYRVVADSAQAVTITERPEPLRSIAGVGLGRRFTVTLPKEHRAWLRVGEGSQAPRLMRKQGRRIPLNLMGGQAEVEAAGRMLVLPQGGGRVVVFEPVTLPAGARWQVQSKGGRWQVLLQLPPNRKAATVQVHLNVWAPYHDDAELFKDLVPIK